MSFLSNSPDGGPILFEHLLLPQWSPLQYADWQRWRTWTLFPRKKFKSKCTRTSNYSTIMSVSTNLLSSSITFPNFWIFHLSFSLFETLSDLQQSWHSQGLGWKSRVPWIGGQILGYLLFGCWSPGNTSYRVDNGALLPRYLVFLLNQWQMMFYFDKSICIFVWKLLQSTMQKPFITLSMSCHPIVLY